MPHVVVVDDQAISRKVLEKVLATLEPAPQVHGYAESTVALAALADMTPDLVLTDYRIPDLDGLELTRRVRALPGCAAVPIVLVTAAGEQAVRQRALRAGVTDFLTKPVDHLECRLRCANLMGLRPEHGQGASEWIPAGARESDLLRRLARVGDYHNDPEAPAGERLGHYVRVICDGLGLPSGQARLIELAARLRDLGHVGVPQSLLLTRGALTPRGRAQMQQHTLIGQRLLTNSPSPNLQCAAQIAAAHHERYDGSGYPQGLSGETIPLAARIVAVADVFDALTSSRPHRPARSVQEAAGYIRMHSATHFDPQCAEAFVRRFREVLDIHRCLSRRPAVHAR